LFGFLRSSESEKSEPLSCAFTVDSGDPSFESEAKTVAAKKYSAEVKNTLRVIDRRIRLNLYLLKTKNCRAKYQAAQSRRKILELTK
jgi:hypothetical protein